MSRHLRFATGIAGLAVVLAACATAATDTTQAGTTATTAIESVATTTAGAAATTAAVSTEDKVSANTATVDEIATALAAAGVDEADRWAREVVEYRPYDTSDPVLSHLREELAKYNPADGVVDTIVSVLEP